MADPAAEPAPLHLPRQIGGYQIQRVIGSGGMATVYAALQKQPRRTVALKVMRSASNPEVALRRFRREIEILGRLRHPYIAQVFDAGVHDDGGGSVPFFVMEYIPGARNLADYAEQKSLPLRDILKLFVKVCAAVEHGHHNKVIHRDLKPANILVDMQGDPKVIDFGVARAVDLSVSSQTMQTDAGSLLGTIQYMAPEQLDTTRQDLDARCDVYALGAVLYKLLTGRAPYDLAGLPVFTAAEIIRKDEPKRPSLIIPELKGDLETIILKALAKDRAQRYRTAGSLGRDLVRFLMDKPINARRSGMLHRARLFMRRHRREVVYGAAIAAIAITSVVATTLVLQQTSATRSAEPRAADVAADEPAGPGPRTGAEAEPAGTAAAASPLPSTPAEGFTLSGLRSAPNDLSFDPSGEFLAAGLPDQRLLMWNLRERRIALSSDDQQAPIARVAFTRDGSTLASIAQDGRIILIDPADARVLARLRTGCEAPSCLAITGDLLAVGCGDLTLRVYSSAGTLHRTLRGTRGAFTTADFSRDGSLLAAGSQRSSVSMFDVESGQLLRTMETPSGQIIRIGFDAAAEHVVAVTSGGSVLRWTIEHEDVTGEALPSVGEPIIAAAFDATGRWLICAASDEFTIIDLSRFRVSGDPVQQQESEIRSVAIAPPRYAIGAADGTLLIGSFEASQ